MHLLANEVRNATKSFLGLENVTAPATTPSVAAMAVSQIRHEGG